MSFEEKSSWVMLITYLLVYGWYFVTLTSALPEDGRSLVDIPYQALMLRTVIALVVIAVVAHVVIASLGSDDSDERDKEINRRGDYIGGYLAAAAALGGMGMAMIELQHFWIANSILLMLVLSELGSSSAKIYFYRRGF